MNKVFLILLYNLLSLGILAQKQEVANYNIYSQKGVFCFYSGDYQCAIDNYEKAQTFADSMQLFDQLYLGLSYASTDTLYFSEAFILLKKVLCKGYPLSGIDSKISSSFRLSKYYKTLKKNQKLYKLKFYKNYNVELIMELKQLVNRDKYIRSNCPQNDSVCKQFWLKTINENFSKIENEIMKNGFPGYQQIGYSVMDLNLILLHGKTHELTYQRFSHIKDIIFKEVLKGNFSPANFAYWVDGYHSAILKDKQIYGTVYIPTEKGKLIYKHYPEEVINNERLQIGLIPIREYCNKMNIYYEEE